MEKPFKVHNVIPIINQLMNPNIKDEDRISFSRAVEMLNEISFKYQCGFKSRYKKKDFSAESFEKQLYELINSYAKNGLSKKDLVYKMKYVTKSCEVS